VSVEGFSHQVDAMSQRGDTRDALWFAGEVFAATFGPWPSTDDKEVRYEAGRWYLQLTAKDR